MLSYFLYLGTQTSTSARRRINLMYASLSSRLRQGTFPYTSPLILPFFDHRPPCFLHIFLFLCSSYATRLHGMVFVSWIYYVAYPSCIHLVTNLNKPSHEPLITFELTPKNAQLTTHGDWPALATVQRSAAKKNLISYCEKKSVHQPGTHQVKSASLGGRYVARRTRAGCVVPRRRCVGRSVGLARGFHPGDRILP